MSDIVYGRCTKLRLLGVDVELGLFKLLKNLFDMLGMFVGGFGVDEDIV